MQQFIWALTICMGSAGSPCATKIETAQPSREACLTGIDSVWLNNGGGLLATAVQGTSSAVYCAIVPSESIGWVPADWKVGSDGRKAVQ